MRVEHVAFLVDDPVAMSKWYCEHLGMKVVRYGGPPTHMTFLQDSSGKTMFEIYTKDDLETPDYASMHVSVLHLAFCADDVKAERQRLIDAGATPAQDVFTTPAGDEMTMVRDPWGLTVQLLKRKEPMGA
ncbi:MAG: VOC family protein [bacterium]|nr:VOC family protein [bacterium]